tara:strand:+ start:1826 stop:2200 length:375 start_codon:yes stop_codon:yes gene_type:complete
MDNQIKIAVLEQKIEDIHTIVSRLDTAIEKLSEVNTTVSRMLAVHEERITKQEKIDELLFTKIDKLRDKMDFDHNLVLSRISGLEKKVWIGMGIVLTISLMFRAGGIFQNILTPAPQEVIVRKS